MVLVIHYINTLKEIAYQIQNQMLYLFLILLEAYQAAVYKIVKRYLVMRPSTTQKINE